MDFKWLRNGKELSSGSHNVNILSYPLLSNLIIDPLTSEDSVPPSWIVSPSDTDASSGDSLMLNCKGTGKPEPNIIWSRTHEVRSLKIQSFSFPEDSVIGKRVSASCTPAVGEKMDFKWLKNGKEIIPKGQNINIVSFSDFSTIVINPLTAEDSGNYTCVVSTRGLSGSYTTVLNVLVPPSWKQLPQDYEAADGETVVLHCQGAGKPEPVTNWFHTTGFSSDYIPLSSTNRITVASNGSVIISAITKDDEGMYQCNVSNRIGSDLVKAVMVKVTGCSSYDHRVRYRGSNEVWEGDRFEVSCIVPFSDREGWTINSSIAITDDNDFSYTLSEREVDTFRQELTLHVRSAQLFHEGEYRCNRDSRDFHYVKIIPASAGVHEKGSRKESAPPKATNEYILEINKTVEFYCSSARDDNTPVMWYKNSRPIVENSNRTS
ncbi:Down syndrome cell adhesion molecule like protein [Argiope bruennichi]|uniref:Down syndrome cell adhesion molecule like protein n=1 Tax=Argiope bruennichi TaxID=94029 RepID=A0A8T0FSC0_ARGBR|nr:Down syndrome cell adhesion molecule like protein [Argiope bruennichi]